MTLGVIISTYNNPEWLEKTLWGYMCQSRPADEIVIADDGSTGDTRRLIERYSDRLPLRHVWHEDDGFRKTKILNEALRVAQSDYLVFTDQDCVPRRDFLAVHAAAAEPGRFLSGGAFRLPMDISRLMSRDDIESGRAFDLTWLRANGLPLSFKCTKLVQKPWFSRLMNTVTPAGATWNGGNASTWRKLLLAARGFDERLRYGGEDRELGERLVNAGVRGKQVRYSAVILHLDHGRPYVNQEAIEANNAIRRETRASGITATEHGL